jgi:hypothetical protein
VLALEVLSFRQLQDMPQGSLIGIELAALHDTLANAEGRAGVKNTVPDAYSSTECGLPHFFMEIAMNSLRCYRSEAT